MLFIKIIMLAFFGNRFSLILVDKFLSVWRMVPDWVFFLTAQGKEYKKHLKVIHEFTSKVSK